MTVCVCVCVCEFEFVSWGVTQRGESSELRLTVKCSVSSETEREMVFCSRRAASSPHSITHAEPSVWNALLSKFRMTWGDVPLLRYRGVLSFESSSVSNDKPRSSDGRERSRATQASCHWLFTVFCVSICHRDSARVSSSFTCTIKDTSWQCWPCLLLSVSHKIKQDAFVLEFLCHVIIKLARWALYWNHSCFLLFFFWHFSVINSASVVHRTL